MQSKYSKITLGGLSGTGKGTISRILAEKLGFERASTGDFFREVAKEQGLTIVELDKKSVEDDSVDILTDKKTEEFGKTHNNFVMESRLAAHFIPDAFKILLLCDDKRYERIAERDGISIEQAKKDTQDREGTYDTRFEELYKLADFDDPKYYDFVIDTTELTPDEILEKIINNIT